MVCKQQRKEKEAGEVSTRSQGCRVLLSVNSECEGKIVKVSEQRMTESDPLGGCVW